jgi:hypothetical protein
MYRPVSTAVLFAVLALATGCATVPRSSSLRSALTFYAPFDGNTDAAFAKGDPRLFNAPSMKAKDSAARGLPTNHVIRFAPGEGRFGDAIRFTKKQAPFLFYRAATNVHYAPSNWSGTVSFWLNTDPINELETGFCDPLQVTPRAWNDAAFFVEFEKRETIPFRLGVYSDFKVWNPNNTEWGKIPFSQKPLVTVENPPFAKGKWTHIVFTWENFNTGQSNGVPKLYLDGRFQGQLSPRVQTFTWDPQQCLIGMGIAYKGLFDELSAFNRALSEAEVKELHGLPQGVRSLLGK